MEHEPGKAHLTEGIVSERAGDYMDEIPVALMIHGPGNKFLYANRKACENLGYSRDELIRMTVQDIDPAVSLEDISRIAEETCTRGSTTFETTHRRKDGSVFPVQITSSLTVQNGQRLAITIAQDITERNKTHDALRLAQFAFSKSCIATYRNTPDGRIIDANEMACASLGYTHEELCNLNLKDIDPNASESQLNSWSCELNRKKAVTIETIHRRKDGSQFPVEIIAHLLEYGAEKYCVSNVRDITKQQAAAKQKARMQVQLRKALRMEALGTLAGGIAHDFRNVLLAIKGYSDLAGMNCTDPASVLRFLKEIGSAIDRADQLVGQIFDFSRQNKSTKRRVDIGRVFNETLQMIKTTFPETIRITHDCHPDPGILYADETRVHQVIMNLCTNAHRAMSEQGGTLDLKVVPASICPQDEACSFDLGPGQYLKIIVTDTGHGMEPDILERAFDPYFTTNHSGEGAGMGLAIVHGIVKDHGGAIKVVSEPGKGTTFTVFLPLAESLPDDRDFAAEPGLPTGNESILLVDDEKAILDVVKALLDELGYGVEIQADSIKALETFQLDPRKFDLIMTDYFMPRMNGDHLAREVKEFRPDIPIILFTGFNAEINDIELAKAGISEILPKPITLTVLAKTVRKILDGTKAKGPLNSKRGTG